MNNERVQILSELQDRESRQEFSDDFVNTYLALQIKALRQKLELSQAELAEAIGTGQSMVSRLENVNNGSWSVSTLKKLAAVFDLPLQVKFGSWGELVNDGLELGRSSLERVDFASDPGTKGGESVSFDDRSGVGRLLDFAEFCARSSSSVQRESSSSSTTSAASGGNF